uniref:Uncharacterized protein n=1 Tax=Anguilla anguilla TaxID=7936 RepID=A0A0E9QAV3_ANGAN
MSLFSLKTREVEAILMLLHFLPCVFIVCHCNSCEAVHVY